MPLQAAKWESALSPIKAPLPSATQTLAPLPILVIPLAAASRLAWPASRLVVLVPDADTDESELAGQLWPIASAHRLGVMLIGVFRDPRREPHNRRRLAALAALIRDDAVPIETSLAADTDWLAAVRSLRRAGDIVVCHAEWRIRCRGLQTESLSLRLAREFGEPVFELSGFYPDLPPDGSGSVSRSVAWGGAILIVAVFTALEYLIQRTAKAPADTPLMSLCVLVEYGLLGLWACQLV